MILLGNTRHHFTVKRFTQRLMRLHGVSGIFIFGAQIRQHLRVGAVIITQPVIVIDAFFAVYAEGFRAFFSLWRCHHRGISLSS